MSRMQGIVRVLLGFVLILLPAQVFGNGFSIQEQDAAAFSMAGAFVAQADNPSALYYNPAGMVQLPGTQVSAGFALIMPNGTFSSNGTSAFGAPGETYDQDDQTFFVPNIYVTHQINDQWSIGLAEFTNFGLSSKWPKDWEGRFLTGGTEATLLTASLNPSVAYQPMEKLSLGLGLTAQYVDITLKNKLFLGMGLPEGNVKLSGDNWDYGWNVGLLFKLTDEIKFGASYRSKIKHDIEGETKISGLGMVGLPDIKVDAEAELELPDIAYVGLAWARGPLTLEFDVQWTGWSSYDELAVQFDQPIMGSTGSSSPKNWEDVWAYRFGAQYQLNPAWVLRAGVIFDEAPMPDETFDYMIPSGDRWLYGGGVGYTKGKFTLDTGYYYLDDESRTWNNMAGDYNTQIAPGLGRVTGQFEDVYAHLFMLNVSYQF